MSYYVNGYKIENTTLQQLHSKLKKIQEQARPLAKVAYCNHVMKKVCFEIDYYALQKAFNPNYKIRPEMENNPFVHIRDTVIEEDLKELKKGRRKPGLDVALEFVFYPISDNSFIGIIYSEKDYSDLFLKEGFFDYHYQNSSDGPKEVSKREWKKRREDWEKLIGSGSPSENGFSFCLVKQLGDIHVDIQDMLQNQPTKEDRVKKLVQIKSMDEKRKMDHPEQEIKNIDHYEIMSMLSDHDRWVRETEEGKKFNKDLEDKYSKVLKDSFTKKDILGWE